MGNSIFLVCSVSLEMVRLCHSHWVIVDVRMVHGKVGGIAASARTTDLNEELGQIKYIFSDKTGTLTQVNNQKTITKETC